MTEIFFATMNKDKIMKMKNRLKNLDIKIITPYDKNYNIEIQENGKSVIENATLKAKAYFDKTQIPTIATDSALYVEEFDIQPGLFVKRINGVTLEEDKLEVVCPIDKVKRIVSKLKEIHPYEEPAIDIIPLLDENDF